MGIGKDIIGMTEGRPTGKRVRAQWDAIRKWEDVVAAADRASQLAGKNKSETSVHGMSEKSIKASAKMADEWLKHLSKVVQAR